MEAQRIEFAVRDSSSGHEVSPDRIPLARLKSFARDVDELIRGDAGDIPIKSVEVAVKEGSFALQTMPISNPGLLQDLLHLSASVFVDGMNEKRRAVIERWQKAAKSVKGLAFKISMPLLAEPIVINRDTDFRANDADQWVRVERYVRGEVFELGGSTNINAHIRLADGRQLVVSARRELLQADTENRLFKFAMVRLSADYNIVTREYRNAELIQFGAYDRNPDEEALSRLTSRGAEAWADVSSASEWVDSQRGGLR